METYDPRAEPPIYHPFAVARDPHNTYLMVIQCATEVTKLTGRQ
jgi:hypothetical protein